MARDSGPKKSRPQISPLRCAPVEMTKGGDVMARGGGSKKVDCTSLLTALRSGRDDKGWRGYGPRQRSEKKRPQISPLRCAPVEMTKGGEVMARGSGRKKRDRRSLHCAALRSR